MPVGLSWLWGYGSWAVDEVDETNRLLRGANQSWLPTILQLTCSSDGDLRSLFPPSFHIWFLKNHKEIVSSNFLHLLGIVETSSLLGMPHKHCCNFWSVLCAASIRYTLDETAIRGIERGFKGKAYPRHVKMVLCATLTQDPSKLAQLDPHHPLLLTSEKYAIDSLKICYPSNCLDS